MIRGNSCGGPGYKCQQQNGALAPVRLIIKHPPYVGLFVVTGVALAGLYSIVHDDELLR